MMRGLMRVWLAALAACALLGVARADGPLDVEFYAGVARQNVSSAPLDVDTAWSSAGRAGAIRFSQGAGACRTFFITETAPERKPPVIGDICPAGVVGYSASYTVQNVRLAAAAGPGGEPRTDSYRTGATRGLTAPSAPAAPGATRGLAPPPASTGATRGLSAPSGGGAPRDASSSGVTAVTARIVPLLRTQERIDRAGGHAVVLMRNLPGAAQRNQLLCRSLQREFVEATYAQTEVGVVRQSDGTLARVRPVYWPTDNRIAAGGGDACAVRMRQYDYGRANAIMDKLTLSGAGPFLVVSRDDQRQAAIIDMTDLRDAQINPMVIYFRDRFSQERDIWSGAVNTVQMRQRSLAEVFRSDFTQSLVRTISIFSTSASLGGCIGDTRDTIPCRR